MSASSGRRGRLGWLVALTLYGGAIYVFLYLPIALLMFFSFNRSATGTFPITGYTLDWYRRLFEEFFLMDAFRNSLFVAIIAMVMGTLVGTPCAFGLVRGRFALKGVLTSMILMPMVVPPLLLGAALLIVLRLILHIPLSLWTAALGHIVILTPFAVLVVATRLYGYDRALDAAAADLGATPLQVFRHVTLPLIMPGIFAAALILFTLSLDQFGVTFFTIGPENTLPLYIWSQVDIGVTPAINALGTVFIMVSLLVISLAHALLLRRVA